MRIDERTKEVTLTEAEYVELTNKQKNQLPKWEKRPVGGCWSGEIAVHPSARLFRYEHYVINADKLFELLSKDE